MIQHVCNPVVDVNSEIYNSCVSPSIGSLEYITKNDILPKCRLLWEVDYESMPSFPIFRCSL